MASWSIECFLTVFRWFTNDPAVYKDPATFNPERFLTAPPAPDPEDYVFGFGRRICPGRLLAESSVWLTVAKSLAAFNVGKEFKVGKEVEPRVEFTSGIISRPLPFKSHVKARSTKYEELIRAVEVEHPWEESSARKLEGSKA